MWAVLSSAWYVGATYRGLGEGVAAALAAVVGLVVLFTVPLATWGIAATGGLRTWRGLTGALAVALLLGGARLAALSAEAHGSSIVEAAAIQELERALETSVDVDALPAVPGRRVPLMTAAPAVCPRVPSPARLTLVATYLTLANGQAGPRSRCFQAGNVAEVVRAFTQVIHAEGARGPIKLDFVTRTFSLPVAAPLLRALAFRPGIDGACADDGRCLMPWQLVALDAFVSEMPIPSVPDVRLGVSSVLLAKRLSSSAEKLSRIATESWLLPRGGGLLALGRTPSPEIEVTPETARAAANSAGRYVYLAQKKSGRFKYIVMPFTGRVIEGRFSIARQAGTTLSVCELAPRADWVDRLVERSLGLLAKHEQRFAIGDAAAGALRWQPKASVERIGPTALSLAALIACRARVGNRHDALIARLGRTLLAVQREDGGFRHYIDTQAGAVVVKKGSIYVDGQVVLALSLLEKLTDAEAGPFPGKRVVGDAVERAMTYFGEHYWDIPLEPFLYIEENWHCLAARASLEHHRNIAYEQFCLDYVAMKTRIVHEPGSSVHADFIGGYGFGNVVPPHNTATAGYGEALAAAITIKNKQGLDVADDSARLRRVIGFLIRNQWTPTACYACTAKHWIAGGFSEHMASSRIRIDYVQHAWAAIGHGAIALGWAEEPS